MKTRAMTLRERQNRKPNSKINPHLRDETHGSAPLNDDQAEEEVMSDSVPDNDSDIEKSFTARHHATRFQPYQFVFTHKPSFISHSAIEHPAQDLPPTDAVKGLYQTIYIKKIGFKLKDTAQKKTAMSDAAPEFDFNDYLPEQVLPAHVMPRKIPAPIFSHARTGPGSLGVKSGGPESVVIDLTSDSSEERELANNYEEDLMTQLDRVLCLQQAQAEKNLAKSSAIPESMLTIKTQKRIANMDKEDRKFEEQQQKAKTKKQKAALGRFKVYLSRMRENLDKKVKAELWQIQTKAGALRVTQPSATHPAGHTTIGRYCLRPVLPTRQHAPLEQELQVNDRFGEQKTLPEFQSVTSQQDLKELWQRRRSEQPRRILPRESNLGRRKPRKQICRAAAADPASLPSDPNQPRARAQIESAEGIIGYVFTDKNIIFEALLDYTSGVAKIGNRAIPDANMHLALVGDSILTSVLREDGYHKERSRMSISRDVPPIVTNKNLAGVCKSMQLDYCIYLGESEKPKAHEPSKRLADLMEALVGAVYLDGGLETVKAVMRKMGLLSS